MNITDATVAAANRRATGKKTKFPAVVSVRYDRRVARIVIALASGLELAFSPKRAQGLEDAHPADLMDAEITPSGCRPLPARATGRLSWLKTLDG